jgi:hypothetical protein
MFYESLYANGVRLFTYSFAGRICSHSETRIACEQPHRSFVPAHMLASIGSIEATQVHHGYQPVLPYARHDRLPHLDEPGNAHALPLKLAEFDQQDDTFRSTSVSRYRWYVDA